MSFSTSPKTMNYCIQKWRFLTSWGKMCIWMHTAQARRVQCQVFRDRGGQHWKDTEGPVSRAPPPCASLPPCLRVGPCDWRNGLFFHVSLFCSGRELVSMLWGNVSTSELTVPDSCSVVEMPETAYREERQKPALWLKQKEFDNLILAQTHAQHMKFQHLKSAICLNLSLLLDKC